MKSASRHGEGHDAERRFLRRISADLHDSPAQDLGLALMKVQTLCETCEQCPHWQGIEENDSVEAPSVPMLLQAALAELRTIYAGLQLPKLNALTTSMGCVRIVLSASAKQVSVAGVAAVIRC